MTPRNNYIKGEKFQKKKKKCLLVIGIWGAKRNGKLSEIKEILVV